LNFELRIVISVTFASFAPARIMDIPLTFINIKIQEIIRFIAMLFEENRTFPYKIVPNYLFSIFLLKML